MGVFHQAPKQTMAQSIEWFPEAASIPGVGQRGADDAGGQPERRDRNPWTDEELLAIHGKRPNARIEELVEKHGVFNNAATDNALFEEWAARQGKPDSPKRRDHRKTPKG
jgi:hypothetical protein